MRSRFENQISAFDAAEKDKPAVFPAAAAKAGPDLFVHSGPKRQNPKRSNELFAPLLRKHFFRHCIFDFDMIK